MNQINELYNEVGKSEILKLLQEAIEKLFSEAVRIIPASSEKIGEVLKKYGGKEGEVNLGAYVPKTNEIFINPDSSKYGFSPLEVLGHELYHMLNPFGSEKKADEFGKLFEKYVSFLTKKYAKLGEDYALKFMN